MRCARHGQRCAVPPPTVSCDLGIFRVGRPIGRGGFATVYALVDHPLALKVVSKCSNRDATRAEAAIHKLLNHPSIVRFRASWEDDSRIFILMDRVPGFCLADIVREAPLTEAAARVYAANLLEALSYMHANGIIHRDVKLANLLVTHDRSRAVLCDFGLAVHVSALEGMPHAVCGTPTYVAPEVLELRNPAPDNTQESQLNARPRVGHTRGADAWSAGVVIYSMLIGRGPFDTDDVGRTFRKIRAARFTFPSKMRLSAEAKDLIRSLLTENPAARPTMDQALKHPFFTSWSLSSESRLSSISSDSRGKEGQERPREDRAEDNPRPIGTRKRDISNRFGRAETRRWYGRPRRDSDLGLRHEAYSNMDERTTAFHEGKSSDSSSSAFSPSPYLADRPRSTVITERRSGAVPQTPRVRCHSAINSSSVESSTLYGDGHYDSKAPVQRTRISTPKRRPLISQMSLIVSAATLRGRKLLDDDVKRTGGHTSTQRFDAVAIPVECDNSGKGDYPPPLVRRWLDYTSKYGFATLMEDGRAGCCFNDVSRTIPRFQTAITMIAAFASAPSLLVRPSSRRIHPYTPLRLTSFPSRRVFAMSLSSLPSQLRDIDGAVISSSIFEGKVLFIMNVASACGYTSSGYALLHEICDRFAEKDFVAAVLPCNSFGGQESGTPKQIKDFVMDRESRAIVLERSEVSGPNAHPIFKAAQEKFPMKISWNFDGRYVFDKAGNPVARFGNRDGVEVIAAEIEKHL